MTRPGLTIYLATLHSTVERDSEMRQGPLLTTSPQAPQCHSLRKGQLGSQEDAGQGCKFPSIPPHPSREPHLEQFQKHPHLPAAMVLLGCTLAQPACLLADGWQGLVTGTVIPSSFLGHMIKKTHPKSLTLPKFSSPFSKPEPELAVCFLATGPIFYVPGC